MAILSLVFPTRDQKSRSILPAPVPASDAEVTWNSFPSSPAADPLSFGIEIGRDVIGEIALTRVDWHHCRDPYVSCTRCGGGSQVHRHIVMPKVQDPVTSGVVPHEKHHGLASKILSKLIGRSNPPAH